MAYYGLWTMDYGPPHCKYGPWPRALGRTALYCLPKITRFSMSVLRILIVILILLPYHCCSSSAIPFLSCLLHPLVPLDCRQYVVDCLPALAAYSYRTVEPQPSPNQRHDCCLRSVRLCLNCRARAADEGLQKNGRRIKKQNHAGDDHLFSRVQCLLCTKYARNTPAHSLLRRVL
jgi:hypothetical protein